MKRIRTWTLEDGFGYLRTQTPNNRKLDGFFVEAAYKPSATRLRMFLSGQIACVRCGLVGEHWHVERGTNDRVMPFAVNLYGVRPTKDGFEEIMLTWDHRIPKSLGGSDDLENAQCMCATCNNKKGNVMTLQEMIAASIHPQPLKIWRLGGTDAELERIRLRSLASVKASPKKRPKGLRPPRYGLKQVLELAVLEFTNLNGGVGIVDRQGNHVNSPLDSTGVHVLKDRRYKMTFTQGPFTDMWEGICHKVRKKHAVIRVTRRISTLNGEHIQKTTPSFISVSHSKLTPLEA
jgi:HNH endonuclease